jgi:hypothetical protein
MGASRRMPLRCVIRNRGTDAKLIEPKQDCV